MKTRRTVGALWAVAVLAASAAVRPAFVRGAERGHGPLSCPSPDSSLSPAFEAALHKARRWQVRARSAVRYRGAAEDAAGLGVDREPERLRQMAADRHGYLRRALDAAHRAEGLARTPNERYRAADLLSQLEWEAGHPELELRYARLMVKLRPTSDAARIVLRRAASHNSGRRAGPSSAAKAVRQSVAAPPRSVHRSYPPFYGPRNRPFDAALREAVEWQQRAVDEAARRQEALRAWDPRTEGSPSASSDWQRQIARDDGSFMRQAVAVAQRAAALARTPHEVCRAGALLAVLECSLGRHNEELRQARRLGALQPRNELALLTLLHAARCNRLKHLEDQTTALLARLHRRR